MYEIYMKFYKYINIIFFWHVLINLSLNYLEMLNFFIIEKVQYQLIFIYGKIYNFYFEK